MSPLTLVDDRPPVMYEILVFTLDNVGINIKNGRYQKRVILRSTTLPKSQCTAEQYHFLWYLMYNADVN